METDQNNTRPPFVPHKAEKYIDASITNREANLISKLRKYSYGKFTVHKVDGLLVRLEINDSQIIDENPCVDLT